MWALAWKACAALLLQKPEETIEGRSSGTSPDGGGPLSLAHQFSPIAAPWVKDSALPTTPHDDGRSDQYDGDPETFHAVGATPSTVQSQVKAAATMTPPYPA